MGSSILYFTLFICVVIRSTNCEVLARSVNNIETSMCFLNDNKWGVCKLSCPGQDIADYQGNVCNPGGVSTLYCCENVDRRDRYPTIDEVCKNHRLEKEFYRRGLDEYFDLSDRMQQLVDERDQRNKDIQKDCYQKSLEKEEDERMDYIKRCLEIKQYFKLSLSLADPFRHVETVGIGWKGEGYSIDWKCAGMLIHEAHVLTTADCLAQEKNPPEMVRLGREGMRWGYADVSILKVYVHDAFDSKTLENNLAILRIETNYNETLSYGNKAVPICLWTEEEIPKEHLYVSGVKGGTDTTFFDKQAVVETSSSCENSLKTKVTDNQICVKIVEDIEDDCENPSCGSLKVVEDDWIRTPYLVGLTSCQKLCGNDSVTVSTSFYPYLSWIEIVISGSL